MRLERRMLERGGLTERMGSDLRAGGRSLEATRLLSVMVGGWRVCFVGCRRAQLRVLLQAEKLRHRGP